MDPYSSTYRWFILCLLMSMLWLHTVCCSDEPMNAKANRDVLDRLKRYAELSREVESKLRALEAQVGSTKLTAVDGFKPYINPKRNVSSLLSFYDTFMSARDCIETEYGRLSGVFGEAKEKDGFSPRDLGKLKEKEVLESMQRLIEVEKTLRGYENIRMVATELDSLNRFIGKVLDALSESFFISLKKLPEKDPELLEFAAFLLSNTDKKAFISEYTNTVYSIMGFDDIGTNTKLLLDRTKNLTRFFSGIVEMNDHILGVENSKATNTGLLKMFIIGLRRTIADILVITEKKEKAEDIPFLVSLNSHINHSAGPRIDVIEELFVFKNEINKIIYNCMLGYFEELSVLESPCKCSDVEPLCIEIIDVLNAFYDHRDVAEAFASAYGSDLNVRTAEDMFVEFSSRTIERVLVVADSLRGIAKDVYVINNVYGFQNYLEETNGIPISEMISASVKNILEVWEKELYKRKEDDITDFLDKNIENQSKYLLPAEIRGALVGRISKLIADTLKNKKYTNGVEELHSSIAKLYSAGQTSA